MWVCVAEIIPKSMPAWTPDNANAPFLCFTHARVYRAGDSLDLAVIAVTAICCSLTHWGVAQGNRRFFLAFPVRVLLLQNDEIEMPVTAE